METYTRELYRHLGELDDRYEYVAFVSREAESMDLSWFPGTILRSGISGENRFAWALGELFAVSRTARRVGVDLVHAPATLGPRKTSMPTVLTLHDMLYWSHPDFMSTPLFTGPVKWMERVAVRNAKRVITISSASADEIVKYLGVPREHLDIVPLAGERLEGVDRSLAGIEGPLILAMGNRRPHKNWEALLYALSLLPSEERPRVVITGGRGEDPLAPLAAGLGLEPWVDLRGWVGEEEVRHLYSTASALAIPSKAEGFSLPTLEAMAAGVPVLLSDIPVHRFVGGDAAEFFEPDDHHRLAELMRAVSREPIMQAELAAAGLVRASEFSWRRTAEQTLRTFDLAIG